MTKVDPSDGAIGKPRGRDEIIEAVVAATHRILATSGPVKLTMRSVAAEANVNVGLLHRHFGSRADLLRAASDQMRVASEQRILDTEDLPTAISVMFKSEGEFGHGIAWSILQGEMDSVLPSTFPALDRLRALAVAQDGDGPTDGPDASAVKVASLMAMLLGWKLYAPYLMRGLRIADVDRAALDEQLDAILRQVARTTSAHPRR